MGYFSVLDGGHFCAGHKVESTAVENYRVLGGDSPHIRCALDIAGTDVQPYGSKYTFTLGSSLACRVGRDYWDT